MNSCYGGYAMPDRWFDDVAPVAGLEPQIGLLLAMLDDNTREWRKELGAVSDAAVVWQPFPKGHSIGGLILHIADVEAWWLHEVAGQQPRTPEERDALLSSATDQYAVSWPSPPAQPLPWYLSQHDAVRSRTREIVGALDDPALERTERSNAFTIRWLLHHVITHEAYHGGQA